MPIYMDRHDVSAGVTAEIVAELHKEDLKIQHKYGCRSITYWFDSDRKIAFCLIDAPNKKALIDMHNDAHGEVPHKIIEVDEMIVESFLGRIENPEKSHIAVLNIIDNSAFRILMVIETRNYLNRLESNQYTIFTQKFHNSVTKTLHRFNGRIVQKDNNHYLVSFKSVSDAVLCALKIQFKFKYVTPKFEPSSHKLKIALSSGIAVTNKDHIFEDAIVLATRMCGIVNETLVIAQEVKTLYENENRNASIDRELARILSPEDEKFLTQLMDFIEKKWNNPDFNVSYFSEELGYSKSQLYRKLKALTGQSPNNFLKEFRLHKALDLLHQQYGNISEIAFETGFNKAAYFSKCFLDKYGILPSKYIQ
jgi:AraC-like DNA-binding protein